VERSVAPTSTTDFGLKKVERSLIDGLRGCLGRPGLC
jgi:hypothetical protein